MSKIIIGIDPDSKAHGVSIYINNELRHLFNFELLELMQYAEQCVESSDFIEVHIEDVCANKFIYSRNNHGNKSVTSKIAMAIGRCQQSQIELLRFLDHHGITCVLHKPQKGNWAKNKAQFEKVTGWKGRSNEDTRSAAYFGWLGCK